MIKMKYVISIAAILLIATSPVSASSGGLDVKVGYSYIDHDGNESVDQASYNYYEGIGVSMENAKMSFDNGILVRSNLRNINLDNRNLYFNISKPGLFGAKVRSNKYRRIYDFDGNIETKRDLTSADIWFHPFRQLKLFGGGDFNYVSGETGELFSSSFGSLARHVDYERQKYSMGGLYKYQGRMIRGEYGTSKFKDKIDETKDQTRDLVRVIAMTPAPEFDWLILSGTYQHFKTEYDDTGFELKSDTYKGSLWADISNQFAANYIIYFNRAGSDSDFVESDNLSHSIYLKYKHSTRLGALAGYQNSINDDYEDAVKTNAYFLECWGSPTDKLSLRAKYGFRADEIDEGQRLLGDEDRNRFKVSAKYRAAEKSSLKLSFESRKRKNEQLESENDYMRFNFAGTHNLTDLGLVSIGYSFSDGKYTNRTQIFEYDSHQLHAGLNSHPYENFTLGAMAIYYRYRKDLDTEGSDLRFTGAYDFMGGNRIELVYNVFNFDDFLFRDQYYTANIVEINIIKSFNY